MIQAVRADVEPTYSKDIAPIIAENCLSCHRPNGDAPFSLITFEDMKKRARQIAQVTQSRFMPPWLPARDSSCVEFEGQRGLSDEQIAMIKTWVEAGAPQGDPESTPAVPEFKTGWQLGRPDLILTMSEPFTVPAESSDVLRTFVIPVDIDEDKFISAIELLPGNPRAIHHASFLIDTTGSARMLDDADAGPGYSGMANIGLNPAGSAGGWALGSAIRPLPAGTVRRLPARCDIVLNIHFNTTGKPEQQQVQVGLHFAKPGEGASKELQTLTLASYAFDVPAETKRSVVDEFVLPVDVNVIGLSPHAHYLCTRMSILATLPDGSAKCLLKIDDWDFNWQQPYQLKQPLPLPGGTKLRMEFDYDNTAANPRNPHAPPRDVRVGHGLADEMALTLLFVTAANAENAAKLAQANKDKQIQRMEQTREWLERQE